MDFPIFRAGILPCLTRRYTVKGACHLYNDHPTETQFAPVNCGNPSLIKVYWQHSWRRQ